MTIKITDQEGMVAAASLASLRRNRLGNPDMSSTDRGAIIAGLRVSLLRAEPIANLALILYKFLYTNDEAARDRWIVVSSFPNTPIWNQIHALGTHYHDSYGYDRGHLSNNTAENVGIYAGMLITSGYPLVVRRVELQVIGDAIRSHLDAIARGGRAVTCTKCGVQKIVNEPCHVCGFTPKAVRREGKS